MKKIKSLKVMYLSLGVALVSVAAVGFSNWILINEQSSDGFIEAQIGGIKETTIEAKITKSDDLYVRFDANDNNEGLITNGSATETEKLTFSVELTIDKGELASFDSLKVTFDFNNEDGGAKKFIETIATNPQYINAEFLKNTYVIELSDTVPENEVTSGDGYLKYCFTIAENVATIKASFSFKWGTAFGGENPCNEKVSNTSTVLTNFGTKFTEFKNSVSSDNQNSNIVLTITPGVK